MISNRTLSLRVKTKSEALVNFTWRTIKFSPRMLTLELDFEDPLSISVLSIDRLAVIVRDREMFTAKTGVIIAAKYTMESKLPK